MTAANPVPHRVVGRLLVVDDDTRVRIAVGRGLRLAGHDVSVAADAEEALAAIDDSPVDVVVLDVAMPGVDGLQVCRRLRDRGNRVPVLMLTARDSVGDRVAGLDAGADDYLVKPFALEELLARVRALLRRRDTDGETSSSSSTVSFADLELDCDTREVSRGGRRIELTRTEFALLELFLTNPRRVLTREIIVDRVWDCDVDLMSNSLEVYIGYVRRKTEATGEPRLIHTVRGVGYVMRMP